MLEVGRNLPQEEISFFSVKHLVPISKLATGQDVKHWRASRLQYLNVGGRNSPRVVDFGLSSFLSLSLSL